MDAVGHYNTLISNAQDLNNKVNDIALRRMGNAGTTDKFVDASVLGNIKLAEDRTWNVDEQVWGVTTIATVVAAVLEKLGEIQGEKKEAGKEEKKEAGS
jgi:hypothetical protein